jgi:hypothetical protein
MNYHDLSLSLAEALVRSHANAKGEQLAPGGRASPRFVVTVSREAGALGNAVATEVGGRLGWPVYDRNILDKIAEELGRPQSRLQSIDERPTRWLEECLSGLMDQYHVSSNVYLKHLFAAVRGLGEVGGCVIVGRGANFLLPAETTLRVRLVASPEDRAREVARRLGVSLAEATAWADSTERERRAFIQQHFRADPADPHRYDLVVNMSRLGVSDAADVIVETLRRLERRRSCAVEAAPPAGKAGVGAERPALA